MPAICTLTKVERAELERLVDLFSGARSDIESYLTDLIDAWQEALDGRSEKWRESEAGAEAQERLETLQGWLEGLPEDDVPDFDSLSR